jgi:hypothetical protein
MNRINPILKRSLLNTTLSLARWQKAAGTTAMGATSQMLGKRAWLIPRRKAPNFRNEDEIQELARACLDITATDGSLSQVQRALVATTARDALANFDSDPSNATIEVPLFPETLLYEDFSTIFYDHGLLLAYINFTREQSGLATIDWDNPPDNITVSGIVSQGKPTKVLDVHCTVALEITPPTKSNDKRFQITLGIGPDGQFYPKNVLGYRAKEIAQTYVRGKNLWIGQISNEIEEAVLSAHLGTRKDRRQIINVDKLFRYLSAGGLAIDSLWQMLRSANPTLEQHPQKLYLVGYIRNNSADYGKSVIRGIRLITEDELARVTKIGSPMFAVPFMREGDRYVLDEENPLPNNGGSDLALIASHGDVHVKKFLDLRETSFDTLERYLNGSDDFLWQVLRFSNSKIKRGTSPLPSLNFDDPGDFHLYYYKPHGDTSKPVTGLRLRTDEEESPQAASDRAARVSFSQHEGQTYVSSIAGKGNPLTLGLAFFTGVAEDELGRPPTILEAATLAGIWGIQYTVQPDYGTLHWSDLANELATEDNIDQLLKVRHLANPTLERRPSEVVLVTRKHRYEQDKDFQAIKPLLLTPKEAEAYCSNRSFTCITFKLQEDYYIVSHVSGDNSAALAAPIILKSRKVNEKRTAVNLPVQKLTPTTTPNKTSAAASRLVSDLVKEAQKEIIEIDILYEFDELNEAEIRQVISELTTYMLLGDVGYALDSLFILTLLYESLSFTDRNILVETIAELDYLGEYENAEPWRLQVDNFMRRIFAADSRLDTERDAFTNAVAIENQTIAFDLDAIFIIPPAGSEDPSWTIRPGMRGMLEGLTYQESNHLILIATLSGEELTQLFNQAPWLKPIFMDLEPSVIIEPEDLDTGQLILVDNLRTPLNKLLLHLNFRENRVANRRLWSILRANRNDSLHVLHPSLLPDMDALIFGHTTSRLSLSQTGKPLPFKAMYLGQASGLTHTEILYRLANGQTTAVVDIDSSLPLVAGYQPQRMAISNITQDPTYTDATQALFDDINVLETQATVRYQYDPVTGAFILYSHLTEDRVGRSDTYRHHIVHRVHPFHPHRSIPNPATATLVGIHHLDNGSTEFVDPPQWLIDKHGGSGNSRLSQSLTHAERREPTPTTSTIAVVRRNTGSGTGNGRGGNSPKYYEFEAEE